MGLPVAKRMATVPAMPKSTTIRKTFFITFVFLS